MTEDNLNLIIEELVNEKDNSYFNDILNRINTFIINNLDNEYSLKKEIIKILAKFYGEKEKYDEMEKYYLMAIEKYTSTKSMIKLAKYYRKQKRYDEMAKYYLMAFDRGNRSFIILFDLGFYYYHINYNFIESEKYYLLAIEKDNICHINLIALYKKEKKYDEIEKHCLSGIENGNKLLMRLLAIYYKSIKEDFENAEKYFSMAIVHDDYISILLLGKLYSKQQKYYQMINLHYNKVIYKFYIELFSSEDFFGSTLFKEKTECFICLEEKELIVLRCFFHYCCVNCHKKVCLNRCPYCRL
jgi:tetratricopeptide (TPR) repeat protein